MTNVPRLTEDELAPLRQPLFSEQAIFPWQSQNYCERSFLPIHAAPLRNQRRSQRFREFYLGTTFRTDNRRLSHKKFPATDFPTV